MERQFSLQEMTYERQAAIDGKLSEVKAEATASIGSKSASSISAGAFACFQSHRLIWQKLLESGENCAVVLEDDVLLAENFASALMKENLPARFGVIKLETNRTRVHLGRRSNGSAGDREIFSLHSYHAGTAGYILSAPASQVLLDCSNQIVTPVDEFIFKELHLTKAGLAAYQMVPAPVIQGAVLPERNDEWVTTSIIEHWAAGQVHETDITETGIQRLARRATQELRARVMGTRYKVVPFG